MLIFFGLCASVIYVSVFLMLTTVSFWFEDRIGVHPPVWNMMAFGRYPLTIYSPVVQFFLVLDCSVRPGVVLSQRSDAGPHCFARVRATGSRSRRRVS